MEEDLIIFQRFLDYQAELIYKKNSGYNISTSETKKLDEYYWEAVAAKNRIESRIKDIKGLLRKI